MEVICGGIWLVLLDMKYLKAAIATQCLPVHFGLEELTKDSKVGPIASFILEGSDLVTLTQALPDGYYVVLVVDRSGSQAYALHQLRRAAEVIAEEIV